LVPILASSSCFAWFAVAQQMPVDFWSPVDPSSVVNLPTPSWFTMIVFALMIYAGALAGAFIRVTPFGSGVLFSEARAFAMRWRDVLAWAAGVAVFGTLIWLGAMHRSIILPVSPLSLWKYSWKSFGVLIAEPISEMDPDCGTAGAAS
jgi:hypothetical protein